jgi:hypothetical protein
MLCAAHFVGEEAPCLRRFGGKVVVQLIGLFEINLDFRKLVSVGPISSGRTVRVEEFLPLIGRVVGEDFVLIGHAILSVAGRHELFVHAFGHRHGIC